MILVCPESPSPILSSDVMFLRCTGVMIDDIHLPEFSVEPGMLLALHWSKGYSVKVANIFRSYVAGTMPAKGIEVSTPAAIAAPSDEALLNGLASDLVENDLPEDLVADIGRRVTGREPAVVRGNGLPGNIRTRLALWRASRNSKFVIVSTSGMDSIGEKQILADAASLARRGWSVICEVPPVFKPTTQTVEGPDQPYLEVLPV